MAGPAESPVARLLRRLDLRPGPEVPCPYLPQKTARHGAFQALSLPPGFYHELMDLGFRRSGTVLYRNCCPACHQCRPLRVPLADFSPSRSQRRCLRKNADTTVAVGQPQPTEEKYQLFRRFLGARFSGEMSDSRETFLRFLYESPVETHEAVYRVGGRLMGVGIFDLEPRALSPVYFYFAPEFSRRSPGLFSMLWELEYARLQDRLYYYGGFYVQDCPRMSYKNRLRPYELLEAAGRWVRHET